MCCLRPLAARDDFLRRLAPCSFAEMIGRPESARICLPSSTLVPSRRTTSGTCSSTCLRRVDHALGDDVALHDAAEDVDQDRLHASGSRSMILNASVTFSAVAPPPTSRKLAGLAAVELDDVHRRHREAGAVHQAADVAVERDVARSYFDASTSAGSSSSRSRIATMSGWRKSALSSKLIFASSAITLAVAGDDQRIDLGERGVGLVEALVERLAASSRACGTLACGNADLARDVVGLGVGEARRRDR